MELKRLGGHDHDHSHEHGHPDHDHGHHARNHHEDAGESRAGRLIEVCIIIYNSYKRRLSLKILRRDQYRNFSFKFAFL